SRRFIGARVDVQRMENRTPGIIRREDAASADVEVLVENADSVRELVKGHAAVKTSVVRRENERAERRQGDFDRLRISVEWRPVAADALERPVPRTAPLAIVAREQLAIARVLGHADAIALARNGREVEHHDRV